MTNGCTLKKNNGLGSDDNGWITTSDKFWQKRGMKPIDGKPPCEELLHILFGNTPRFRGHLMFCGRNNIPSSANVGSTSQKTSSKKRESPLDGLDSPAIRKSASSVKEVADYVKSAATRLVDETLLSEADQAVELLKKDGFSVDDRWYSRALLIFSAKEIHQRYFVRYCLAPQVRFNFLVEKWRERELEMQKLL